MRFAPALCHFQVRWEKATTFSSGVTSSGACSRLRCPVSEAQLSNKLDLHNGTKDWNSVTSHALTPTWLTVCGKENQQVGPACCDSGVWVDLAQLEKAKSVLRCYYILISFNFLKYFVKFFFSFQGFRSKIILTTTSNRLFWLFIVNCLSFPEEQSVEASS